MARRLLCFLLFATIVVTSHGETNSDVEEYWTSVLPHTPMPRALAELLTADSNEVVFHVRKDEILFPNSAEVRYLADRYHGIGFQPASDVHLNPTLTLYVHEHELRVGQTKYLSFRKTSGGAFIPRASASTKPFSSAKLTEIVEMFRITPDTDEAHAMGLTLSDCEARVSKDEKKLCATSLESIVDFAIGSLGTRLLNVVSTTVLGGKEDPTPRSQQYAISSVTVMEAAGAGRIMSCHKMAYPYAVFYCHRTSSVIRVYQVALAGADGTPVQAVVVCHLDTSSWSPKHVAFVVLHQKPGTTVCHFLEADDVVWSRMA